MNSDRLARPVSGSCEAWWWSSSLSRPSCSSDCSSWPFSSAMAVWLASVSNSLRSSASNVLMSLSGSDTRSVPTSVDSPSNGATSALPEPPAPDRVGVALGRQVDQPALPLGHRAHEDRIVEGRPDRLHDLDRVAGPDLAAQHLVARRVGAAAGSRRRRPGTSCGRDRAARRAPCRAGGCAGGSASTRYSSSMLSCCWRSEM